MPNKEFQSLKRGGYAEKRTIEKHPSFGQLGFYRTQGGSSNLYGSSIEHNGYITLEISYSEKHRDLNQNWYHPREEIIRIAMSPTQFAEAITSIGSEPIPVTIQRLNGESIEPCPSENTRKRFKVEFKRDVETIIEDVECDFDLAKEMLARKGALKVADRKKIIGVLSRIKQAIKSNLPFVYSQFDRATEKTITEARGEIEAFFENKVRSLGLDALKNGESIPHSAPDLYLDVKKEK